MPVGNVRYPVLLLDTLVALNEGILKQKGKGAGVCEGPKARVGKNIAFWQFLSEVPITSSGETLLRMYKEPNDLAAFCSDKCYGNLDVAISGIDRLVRLAMQQQDLKGRLRVWILSDIGRLIESGDFEWSTVIDTFPLEDELENEKLIKALLNRGFLVDLLEEYIDYDETWDRIVHELQDTSSFIRDVAILVWRNRSRTDRTKERRKEVAVQQGPRPINELDEFIESDATRMLAKLRGANVLPDRITRIQHPLYPLAPSAPHPMFAGYCFICHRPSPIDSHYCLMHTKPKKGDLEKQDLKKGRELAIKRAFQNVKPRLKLDNTLRTKTLLVKGWAIHHPKHKLFYTDLKKIEEEYIGKDDKWSLDNLEMLNRILKMSKRHHLIADSLAGQPLVTCNQKTLDSLLEIQNNFLGGGVDTILPPSRFSECINRMSAWSLIIIASKKLHYGSVLY